MNKNATIAIALLPILSCGSQEVDHVSLELKNEKLEDVKAGQWIKEFDIDYSAGSKPLKSQIAEQLIREGLILADYHEGRRSNDRKRNVLLLWRGHTFLLEEYFSGESGSEIWINLFIEDQPCNEFIFGDKKLNGSGDNLHKATIRSGSDYSRLFLFGLGSNCERISLF